MKQSELDELLRSIAEPTFKYFMKRVENNIINNSDCKNMDVQVFMSIIIHAVSMIAANSTRFAENFYNIKTAKLIDEEALKSKFINTYLEQLKHLKK